MEIYSPACPSRAHRTTCTERRRRPRGAAAPSPAPYFRWGPHREKEESEEEERRWRRWIHCSRWIETRQYSTSGGRSKISYNLTFIPKWQRLESRYDWPHTSHSLRRWYKQRYIFWAVRSTNHNVCLIVRDLRYWEGLKIILKLTKN